MTHESYILLCSRAREPGRVDKDEGGCEGEEARELTQEAVILFILLVAMHLAHGAASLNRRVAVRVRILQKLELTIRSCGCVVLRTE